VLVGVVVLIGDVERKDSLLSGRRFGGELLDGARVGVGSIGRLGVGGLRR